MTEDLQQPPQRKRGRKKGFILHQEDIARLQQAARMINARHAANAGQAFSRVTNGDETAIRRLHRHWKEHGPWILDTERRAFRGRCDLEYWSLREDIPTLWCRVAQFVASSGGKRLLRKHADKYGIPAHPMALGVAYLFEEIKAYENGSGAYQEDGPRLALVVPPPDPDDHSTWTKSCLGKAIEAWVDGGMPITPQTLRELARRVNAFADHLEAANKDGNA